MKMESQDSTVIWTTALNALQPEEIRLLESAKDSSGYVAEALETVQAALRKHRNICVKRRYKVKNDTGNAVVVGDVLEKTISWIQKYGQVPFVCAYGQPKMSPLPLVAINAVLGYLREEDCISLQLAELLELASRLVMLSTVQEARCVDSGHHRSKASPNLSPELYGLEKSLILLCKLVLSSLTQLALILHKNADATSQGQDAVLSSIATSKASLIDTERSLQNLLPAAETVMFELGTKDLGEQGREAFYRMNRQSERSSLYEQPFVRTADFNEEQDTSDPEQNHCDIFDRLSDVRHIDDHRSVYDGVIKGAGRWILHRSEYKAWKASSFSSAFRLCGPPGCGKSKIASVIIQQFLNDAVGIQNSAPVAFFYCSTATSAGRRNSAIQILRSLLNQLTFSRSGRLLRPEVVATWRRKKLDARLSQHSMWSLSLEECVELILAVTIDLPLTFIIDGLDELSDCQELFQTLKTIMQESSRVVKVFLTSRYHAESFSLPAMISVTLRSTDIEEDLKKFVDEELSKSIRKTKSIESNAFNELRDKLSHFILSTTEPSFPRVTLDIEYLAKTDYGEHGQTLQQSFHDRSLLSTETLVREVVHNINANYLDDLKRLVELVWSLVLVAYRPLRATELLCFVTRQLPDLDIKVDPHLPEPYHRIRVKEEPRISFIKRILDICHNFVELDSNQEYVHFTQSHIRESLKQLPQYSEDRMHLTAATVCLQEYTKICQRATSKGYVVLCP